MKLGEVLKKERTGEGLATVELSVEEVAEKLGLSTEEYEKMEAGESLAEKWGPILAQIAIQLETPTARLLAESGKSEDCKDGQAGELIKGHREWRERSVQEMVEAIANEVKLWELDFTEEEYNEVEAGRSPIEQVGPRLLAFAEAREHR